MRQRSSDNANEEQSVPMTWWRDMFPWQNEMTKAFQRMPSVFMPPALQDWEAEDVFTSMQKNMERFMEDAFGTRSMMARWWGNDTNMPSMDLIENEDSFVIRAELPGVDPEDVDISISGHSLTVAGEKAEEREETSETYLCRECLSGSFSRTVVLPDRADLADAEASFENNILTIHIPKRESPGQKVRKLDVSGKSRGAVRENGGGRQRSRRGRPPRGREAEQARH